ncbi:Hypothetical protein MVR_LOCUS329 [uncultured virus]|nr:Hypothetical protein MVR_LOCUS329 [uncultured virus]
MHVIVEPIALIDNTIIPSTSAVTLLTECIPIASVGEDWFCNSSSSTIASSMHQASVLVSGRIDASHSQYVMRLLGKVGHTYARNGFEYSDAYFVLAVAMKPD